MKSVTESLTLRSAFQKIGWAPIITATGIVLTIAVSFILIAANAIPDGKHILSTKFVLIFLSLFLISAPALSCLGYAQARKAFADTKAGKAFASLKWLFLVFTIIGCLSLITLLLQPDTAPIGKAPEKWAILGLIYLIINILFLMCFIVSLPFVWSHLSHIADTTNIESMHYCVRASRYITFTFCGHIAAMVIAGIIGSQTLSYFLGFIILNLYFFSLRLWLKSWLSCAHEVSSHPIEAVKTDN